MVNFSNLPVIKPRATGFGTAEPSVISESMIARRSLGGADSPGEPWVGCSFVVC